MLLSSASTPVRAGLALDLDVVVEVGVERRLDRVEPLTTHEVVRQEVDLIRGSQQIEVDVERIYTVCQFVSGACQALLEVFALQGHGSQSRLELGDREVPISHHLDETVFLTFKPAELLSKIALERDLGFLFRSERLVQFAASLSSPPRPMCAWNGASVIRPSQIRS